MQGEKVLQPQTSAMETKKVAAAYIRVSTAEQEEKRNSPEEQIRCAELLAQDKDFLLEKRMIFSESRSAYKTNHDCIQSDSYINILTTDRPVLKSLLEAAVRKEFTELIVYSRDRLTRNVQESIALKALFKRLKIKIHYSRSGEYSSDEDTTYDNFLEIILSSVAELESNVLSTRVKMGSKTNTLNGFWNGGKTPFGYSKKKIARKKRILTPYHIESSIIKEIYAYYMKDGYGYRKIADKIKEKYSEDIFNIKWNKNTIEWILKNENYTGRLVWGKRSNNKFDNDSNAIHRSEVNKDAVIIDDPTWQIKHQIMEIKHTTKDPKYFDTPFLLKNKLVCGKCTKPLKCKNPGTGKKSVYRCPTLDEKKSELIVEIGYIHEIVFEKLQDIFTLDTSVINNLWSLYEIKATKFKADRDTIVNELRQKTKECNEFQDKLYKIKSNFSNFKLPSNISNEETDKKISNTDSPILARSIADAIEEQITTLTKEITFFQDQLDSIKERKIPKLNTEEEFSNALKKLLENVRKGKQIHKRLIIDSLIDKIIVFQTNGELSLKIIIKTSRF